MSKHSTLPHPITLALVWETARACIAAGVPPSQRAIIRRIGGSHSTIGRHLHTLRKNGSLPPSGSRIATYQAALAISREELHRLIDVLVAIRLAVGEQFDLSPYLAPVEHLLPSPPEEPSMRSSATRYMIPEIQDTATEELP